MDLGNSLLCKTHKRNVVMQPRTFWNRLQTFAMFMLHIILKLWEMGTISKNTSYFRCHTPLSCQSPFIDRSFSGERVISGITLNSDVLVESIV